MLYDKSHKSYILPYKLLIDGTFLSILRSWLSQEWNANASGCSENKTRYGVPPKEGKEGMKGDQ